MVFALSSYHFDLPSELIAKRPVSPRDRSRLMLIERSSGRISEMFFHELSDFLNPGDSFILNDTRVIPARLYGRKESGAFVEILLVKSFEEGLWEALAKPGKKIRSGDVLVFGEDFSCVVEETLSNGLKLLRFSYVGDFSSLLKKYGRVPLPHYISEKSTEEEERELYQTVFASVPGAVAAPTAALHFTEDMFKRFSFRKIERHMLTLHVGPGTFSPVKTEDIRLHKMHSERYFLKESAAKRLNEPIGEKKRICVGTTSCRVLESLSNSRGILQAGEGETDVFIYPGYSFKYVSSLLTNFHLPGSTLLMLVSAFAGKDLIFEAYRKAIKDRFRFYSYGDAMLIL